MGTVDDGRVAPAEINADAPSVSAWISNIIQIWDRRQKVAVEIQMSLCGDRKTDNLIEYTCFYLKVSQVHMFLSKN